MCHPHPNHQRWLDSFQTCLEQANQQFLLNDWKLQMSYLSLITPEPGRKFNTTMARLDFQAGTSLEQCSGIMHEGIPS
jgi:hypothetical protein